MKKTQPLILALALIFLTAFLSNPTADPAQAQEDASLMFIENVGQFPHDEQSRFILNTGQGNLRLTAEALWLTLLAENRPAGPAPDPALGPLVRSMQEEPRRGIHLELSFEDANPQPEMEPFNRLDTHISYFTGDDPADWQIDVPVWAGVRYADLYPGIDLEISGVNGRLAQRLVVQTDPDRTAAQTENLLQNVRLRIAGADQVEIDPAGQIHLTTAIGDVTLPLLEVVTTDGRRLNIAPEPPQVQEEGEITNPFAAPDADDQPGIQVDDGPELLFSTFLEGSAQDYNAAIAVDEAGSAYVTGITLSTDFPTTPGAFDRDAGQDVFRETYVARFNPLGTGLLYATYLGGDNAESAGGLAVDRAGNAYVTGVTRSDDFPTTSGAFDTSLDGLVDAFVVKLNPTGTGLLYATYLGGGNLDTGDAIALDEFGNAYVTGTTYSDDFPTLGQGIDTTLGGLYDSFVAQLTPDGEALVYATYLGGSSFEYGGGIAVDEAGSAYVAGGTWSADFPVKPETFRIALSDTSSAFVAKLYPFTGSLAYALTLGGEADDPSQGIAVDEAGSAYVVGEARSADFPTTAGAFDATLEGETDIYVAKLTPQGDALVYATLLGGQKNEVAAGLVVDEAGQVYVAGYTFSTDFPVTTGRYSPPCPDCTLEGSNSESFVAKLNAEGTELLYGVFLGGGSSDHIHAIARDKAGDVYVAGSTGSLDFPTTAGAFDAFLDDPFAIFVTKLAGQNGGKPTPKPTYTSTPKPTDTPTPKPTYTPTPKPTDTPTPKPTYTPTPKPTDTPTPKPTNTPTLKPTNTPTPKPTATPTSKPHKPTATPTSKPHKPTATPTSKPHKPTATPTSKPHKPTATPTAKPHKPTATPAPVPFHSCAPMPVGNINVGPIPRGVDVDPVRQRVYVANFGDDSVSIIDSATNTVLQTVEGIPSANGLAYDQTNDLVWVTNYEANTVTPLQVDAGAKSVTKLASIPVGRGPWGVVYNARNDYVYVANSLADSVTVIDAAKQKVVKTISGAFDRPLHLAANARTGAVYVANNGGNSVAVVDGLTVSRVTPLWDSGQPYGIAVDETRNLVYVATIQTNRIVVLGPLNGQPDQFLGWASFQRGFDRNRPLPLRVIAVNPTIGPPGEGGHVWTTTAVTDGSESNQALLVPKGWSAYFHVPYPTGLSANPTEGIAIDRTTNRVYITSGTQPGRLSVIGDHPTICPGVAPAEAPDPSDQITLDIFKKAEVTHNDVNTDGLIDIFDLAFIAARYNSVDSAADVNQDGQVDIFDLSLAAGYYSQRLP